MSFEFPPTHKNVIPTERSERRGSMGWGIRAGHRPAPYSMLDTGCSIHHPPRLPADHADERRFWILDFPPNHPLTFAEERARRSVPVFALSGEASSNLMVGWVGQCEGWQLSGSASAEERVGRRTPPPFAIRIPFERGITVVTERRHPLKPPIRCPSCLSLCDEPTNS